MRSFHFLNSDNWSPVCISDAIAAELFCIEFKGSAMMDEPTIFSICTASFDNEHIEWTASMLEQTQPLHYKFKNQVLVITCHLFYTHLIVH
ncbi:hypothetical protein SAMN04487936_10594 [Halobacillus dabanensis]|uniref:Uncharacterized protein n=1 Tax=Halobacillus dabanensis TaxID=240302 RepID=A0A1I3V123_HALDA|nr:hypothetical protein SAMN04487936_10594 [Halobacillus dabanensis]